MITFILLGFFIILAIVLAGVAYSANQRRRAGMAEIPPSTTHRNVQQRAQGHN